MLNAVAGVLRFVLDGGERLKPPNLYPSLKVVDLICKPALNILKFGMNEECTILITYMHFQSCGL